MRTLILMSIVTSILITMGMNNTGWLRVLQSVDSLFPIGAFTLSNGLETYVQKGLVTNKDSLGSYLAGQLAVLPYSDLGFAAKAALGVDFRILDELCTASKSAYELREGSRKLCARFLKLQTALGNYPLLERYYADIAAGECSGCHCIAEGLLIREAAGSTDMTEQGLGMYCYSILSAAVNHAVKLVPLRQLDGQQALAAAAEEIPSACERALAADISELGVGGAGFELRAMQHERLYSRLYIS